MKTLVICTALLGSLVLSSCKKNRVCECKNANSTYIAGELETTKQKAKKHCKSLSNGSTECYLK